MITGSIALKFEYEPTRKGRYGEIRQDVFYTPTEFANAYWDWVKTPSHKREREWDIYCDVRDAVPPGTNAEVRRKRNSSRFH